MFNERLLLEYKQLIGRIELLNKILSSESKSNINREQLELMEKQLNCMYQYEEILGSRILLLME